MTARNHNLALVIARRKRRGLRDVVYEPSFGTEIARLDPLWTEAGMGASNLAFSI
jgi:hypothetical protein